VVSPWAGDSTSTMTLDVQDNQNGSSEITVMVTDSEGDTDSETFTLTVSPVNDPPLLSDIDDQETFEDEDFTIDLSASDVDMVTNAQG
ncbi:uncharacterized protein METZ01_LOCUS373567, partial [marine metagenome]